MNKSRFGFTLLFAAAASLAAAPNASDPAVRAIAHAPLRFEPAGARFVTRGLSFSSALSPTFLDLRSRDQVMRIAFDGASRDARLLPGEPTSSRTNIIRGNDRSKWTTRPNYSTLRAQNLYTGIDAVYYGNQGDLEYDLLVRPGADPSQIRLRITGVSPSLDADGNLNAAFIQRKPVAYQLDAAGARTTVASRYHRNADGTFGFTLGAYDASRELVIDPTLTFAAYIYGTSQDTARAVGHDAKGLIYVAGITLSTDFEIDPNTTQVPGGPQFANNTGGYDIFIAQLDPTTPAGTNPVAFATYLGGSSDDIVNDMYVAPNGLVYLTGYTTSVSDFPTTGVYKGVANTGFQTTVTGTTAAFVVVYDVTQGVGNQLVYSSFMGGGTGAAGNGVTADSKGRVYITGTTNSSEYTPRNGLSAGLQGGSDAFVAGFDPSKSGDSSLIYSTFLGGTSFEQGYGIAAAPDGTLWVVGQTYSSDFPTGFNSPSAYSGGSDGFVVHIDPINGNGNLMYSTYLGGSGYDMARRVAVDAKGRVIVAGFTLSTNFPVTGNALQSRNRGLGDAFVSIINPLDPNPFLQLVYSTYLGGTGADMVNGLALDAAGVIYLTGITGSPDLLVSASAFPVPVYSGQNGFVIKLDPAVGILYSTYVATTGTQTAYGVDVSAKGTIYVAGSTSGVLFDPNVTPKVTDPGTTDAYLFGFTPQ